MTTALVTGATGFIGGAMAHRLLDRGWTVRVLARRPAKARALRERGAEIYAGDVERPATLRQPVRGVDAVVHAAAHVDLIKPDRRALMQTNVEGTRHVLAAAQAAGVGRVLYLSSVAAIGRKHVMADERVWNDGDYQNAYEESKHRAEQVALAFGRAGLDVVHALPSVVVGPGDPKTGFFIKRYLRRRVPAVPSRDGTVSFVHIEDLVDGLELAHAKGRAGERYIFTQATWTTTQMLEALARASGVPPPRRVPVGLVKAAAAVEEARAWILRRPPALSRRAVDLATRRFGYSSEKARRELGWAPADFGERFVDTVRYWQQVVASRG